MTFLRAAALVLAVTTTPALGATFDITIDGGDAIFLAGRTDLTIPPASDPWPGGMIRHPGPTPEEIQETLPPGIAVAGNDIVRVLDPAIGGINYFNGFGPGFFGPAGSGPGTASNLTSFGGISGYVGPQGALAGVFLTDAIPTGPAPSVLTYPGGLDFASLAPSLGQVFYIGDGSTSGGGFKDFIAPAGATRLFFGIPDGFGFNGAPGAYDDNDGAYRIRVGINVTPVPAVPLPAGGLLLASGVAALILRRFRRA